MKRPNEMAKYYTGKIPCAILRHIIKHDPSILFFFKRNHINHASENKEDI